MALADEFFDPHNQVLGPSNGKCRDDNLALVGFGMGEKVQCLLFHDRSVSLVQAIAVGRFKNQYVAWWWWLRIAKNGHIGAAMISAEEQGGRIATRGIFHSDGGRSQYMAGVVKGSCHAWGDLERVSIPCAFESSDKLTDVIGIV